MKELTANDLRGLIRLLGQVMTLRDDTEKSLVLETYSGTGALAVRSFRMLRDQVAQITQDDGIARLDVDADDSMRDKALVSQVMLASGQLLAYLEAQTGVAGLTSKKHFQVQTAPNIDLNMGDVVGGQMDRVMDMIGDAMRHVPRGVRPPQPPRPPREPRAPREGRGQRGPRGPVGPVNPRDFGNWGPQEDYDYDEGEYDEDV